MKKTSKYFFRLLAVPPIISFFLISLSVTGSINDALAQRTKSSQKAGEQRKSEKGLKDNRYFFYFINSSISNFGNENDKKIFKEAVQRDILAQLLYMRFMFMESYTEIRSSQKILIDLYRSILKRDIKASKKMLHGFTKRAIESKDKSALEYLRLGYRDMKTAEIFLVMADNYRSKLYSMRLYKYIRAIKKAKHGKRYGFLAVLIAMDIIALKKEQSKYDSFAFRQEIQDTKIRIKRLSFKQMEKRITEIPPSGERDYYITTHYDSFYRSKTGKTYYDVIWEMPNLQEIKEYNKYLKTEE